MPAAWTYNQGAELVREAAKRTPGLTLEQERELARAIKAGSRVALDRLLRAHLRLVVAMARELGDSWSSNDELISEGLVGLVLAAERYDPERGRFANYASFWIRACIFRYRRRNRRLVCAPSTRHARMLAGRIPRFSRAHWHEHGHEPDAEAIASAFELGVDEVRELLSALFGQDVAYDVSQHDVPTDGLSPEEQVAATEAADVARERVQRALARLPLRERDIVQRRHLDDEAPSLIELGRRYGVSGERVRQIESKAREHMRELLSDGARCSTPTAAVRATASP